MAKTREITCIEYVCEHNCKLGKDAVFYKLCQTCPSYKATPGGKPNRTNTKARKLERIIKREMKEN